MHSLLTYKEKFCQQKKWKFKKKTLLDVLIKLRILRII